MNLQPRAVASRVSRRDGAILDIQLVSVDQIARNMRADWNQIRESNPQFASPYFDFEFINAVARVRSDVRVGVLRNCNHEIIGFFPFQLSKSGHAQPVGGRLNDVHGILKYDGVEVSLARLLQKCQLSSFEFHALNSMATDLNEFVFESPVSYHVDMASGWQQYNDWVRKHSSTVKRQGQKTRGLEREYGQVRFEFESLNRDSLEELIALKRSKYLRSRTFDILSVQWASNLLRELHQVSTDRFQGLLSCLWAGDKLVAGHFGMLSGNVLHYWFPAFNNDFARYSPGTELILRVCEEAAQRGVTIVDFGYGDDPYKFKFCNGRSTLSRGLVSPSRAAILFARERYRLRTKLKKIPLKEGVKTVVRGLYPGFGGWNFR